MCPEPYRLLPWDLDAGGTLDLGTKTLSPQSTPLAVNNGVLALTGPAGNPAEMLHRFRRGHSDRAWAMGEGPFWKLTKHSAKMPNTEHIPFPTAVPGPPHVGLRKMT